MGKPTMRRVYAKLPGTPGGQSKGTDLSGSGAEMSTRISCLAASNKPSSVGTKYRTKYLYNAS